MKKLLVALAFVSCSWLEAVAQDRPSAEELVRQLADESTNASARARLLELGKDAVPALVKELSGDDKKRVRDSVSLLTEIGAPAAPALPALCGLLRDKQVDASRIVLAIAELAPFRTRDLVLSSQGVSHALIERSDWPRYGIDDAVAYERLTWRLQFPPEPDLPLLLCALRGHQPLRVEVAIDHLRVLGSAGAAAAPDLVAILERPEPVMLGTDRVVPLHRKAALALLAIGASGAAAQLAHDVLAGTRTAPKRREPAVPDRAKQRVAELVAELAQADRRDRAIANLVALGELAATPVATVLTAQPDDDTMRAALRVLQGLGRRGAAAVPQLHAAIAIVHAEHLVALLEALTTTAPWSFDAVPQLWYSSSVGSLTIANTRVQGTIDVGFLNAFGVASQALNTALGVDPSSTAAELTQALQSPSVATRERALEVARGQGAAARDLLPVIADMLDARQPKMYRNEWVNTQGPCSTAVDRTANVHRLAAEAIVAIAAADDPLAAKAREALPRSAPARTPDAGK